MTSSGEFDLPLRGIFLYLLQVACFLIIGMLVKTLAPYFAITELLMVRFGFTFAVLLVVIGPKRRPGFLKTQHPIDHMIRTTCGMTALGLTFVALSGAYIANATAVILSGPILAVGLAFFILRETLPLSRIIAVIVGFFGILMIVKPGFGESNTAIYAALGAAFFFAFVIVWLRKLNRTEHPLCISFYYNLSGVVVFLVWTLTIGFSNNWTESPMLLGLLLLLGVTGAAQQILLSYSFRYADASLLAPFEYLSLPLALIVGFIFWSEMPDAISLIGAGTILACGMLLVAQEFRSLRRRPAL